VREDNCPSPLREQLFEKWELCPGNVSLPRIVMFDRTAGRATAGAGVTADAVTGRAAGRQDGRHNSRTAAMLTFFRRIYRKEKSNI